VKPPIITIKDAGILNNPINYLNKLYTRQFIVLPVFLFTPVHGNGRKIRTEHEIAFTGLKSWPGFFSPTG